MGNDAKTDVRKEIKRLYSTKSAKEIADLLNGRGLKSPRGGKITVGYVYAQRPKKKETSKRFNVQVSKPAHKQTKKDTSLASAILNTNELNADQKIQVLRWINK